jgi:hypothetical protein
VQLGLRPAERTAEHRLAPALATALLWSIHWILHATRYLGRPRSGPGHRTTIPV